MKELSATFKLAKDQLATIAKDMAASRLVPAKKGREVFDAEFLHSQVRHLEDNAFIISVCGQIKAGKSTFLNALLFHNDTLPVADSPHTAKLTLIMQGEKTGGTATFYTSEQWASIRNDDELFEKHTRPAVDISFGKGVQEHDVITDSGFERTFSFEELEDFVAADGKYTPFVHQVELKIPHDILKGVVIVDTPGTNDVNRVRSMTTEQWINRSDAVIMLMHSKGLDRQDEQFIDEFLCAVPPGRILFVINQVDKLESIQVVEDYVDRNLRHGKLRDRELLRDDQKVYRLSAEAALIHSMVQHGTPLNEDHIWYRDEIDSRHPEMIGQVGFMEELVQAIDRHLMTNKGRAIVEKVLFALEQVGAAKLEELVVQIRDTETTIEGLGNESKDAQANRRKIEKVSNELRDKIRDVEGAIDSILDEFENNFGEKCTQAKDEAKKEIYSSTDKNVCNNKSHFISRVKESFNTQASKITEEYKRLTRKIEENVRDQLQLCTGLLTSHFHASFYIPVLTFRVLDKQRELIGDTMSYDILTRIVQETSILFWKRKDETRDRFLSLASDIVDNAFSSIVWTLLEVPRQEVKQKSDELVAQLNRRVLAIQADLSRAESDAESHVAMLEEKEATLRELKATLADAEEEVNNFAARLTEARKLVMEEQ